ncbi:RadC family protein [Endozoicomonas sp.]|uniref:RadC family protein n=1 Tax=Endozoicomonas sp. TaxID=1892382 RepID=UPI002888D836|nr:DNA repair protein RadC [Endozoicomonas sp.]
MRAQRWSNTLLPREKMLAMGPAALTEPELLALLLRTGCQGVNVMELADQLLEQFNGLEKLLTAQHQQLIAIKGLGPAKATQLSAILELCRRVLRQKVAQSDIITSPKSTREYLQLHFQGLQREEFACLFLDTRHRIIALETLFQGTLNAATVHPREVVKQALLLNAASLILCHNHPSGDPEPSQADIRITQTLKEALQLVDIQVLDHMIVGQGEILSMAEHGLM